MMRIRALLCLLSFLAMGAVPLFAALRDIQPRPQQMGALSGDPVLIPGGIYLVMASNLNTEEAFIRDLAIYEIYQRTQRTPTILTPAQAAGRTSTLWLITDDRYPQIMSALDSTEIAGLGSFTHDEEYQIYVSDNRIICAANDPAGMRWGLQSLVNLLAESSGNLYVDRVYIRDWPDYNIRVSTINNSCRSPSQVDFCHSIINQSYAARINEIEWNNGDAGQPVFGNPWTISQALVLRQKIANMGMKLTMSCDRTAYVVNDPSWQEGVPQNMTPMRVGAGGFTPITSGFGSGVLNPGFESWTSGRPDNWTTYDAPRWAYISRDPSIRHSGTASVRWTSGGPGTPNSLELRQNRYFGAQRWILMKFWYKTQNFTGQLRFNVYGPPPVATGCDFNAYLFSNNTTDWTLVEHRFSTYNIDSVLFMIGPDIAQAGSLWIDDLSLEPAEPMDLLRRQETTLTVLKRPTNEVMLENHDYRVVETSGTTHLNYVDRPRFERLDGGRLAIGDSVFVNWYCAVPYQFGRQTPCWSLNDNIVDYQMRVRNLDSLFRPDAFKIHINEVSYANYDPLCTARNLTCGELVGSYCRQLYEAIQARRPGAKVRIYGDPVDVWVNGPRAMPISQTPWTVGVLQELHPSMEIMAMKSYSLNLDSSFAYFQANGFPSLMAADGGGFDRLLEGAVAARRWPGTCQGMHFYDYDLALYEQIGDFGDLSWNIGPYFIHTPPGASGANPGNFVITAQAWTDTFRSSTPPSLTDKRVRYRLLPSGAWSDATLLNIGTELYSATINTVGASGIEYYLRATDHRGLTKTCPADAPANTFLLIFSEAPLIITPDYREVQYTTAVVGNARVIEWPSVQSTKWYEVRRQTSLKQEPADMELIARQSQAIPRFVFATDQQPDFMLSSIRVFAVLEESSKADTR